MKTFLLLIFLTLSAQIVNAQYIAHEQLLGRSRNDILKKVAENSGFKLLGYSSDPSSPLWYKSSANYVLTFIFDADKYKCAMVTLQSKIETLPNIIELHNAIDTKITKNSWVSRDGRLKYTVLNIGSDMNVYELTKEVFGAEEIITENY